MQREIASNAMKGKRQGRMAKGLLFSNMRQEVVEDHGT